MRGRRASARAVLEAGDGLHRLFIGILVS
jgi:hypothetical protein